MPKISLNLTLITLGAIGAMAYIATRPGDHSAVYPIIVGLLGLYVKTESTASKVEQAAAISQQNAQKLELIDGKVMEQGKSIDGRLSALLEAHGMQQRAEGFNAGKGEGVREAEARAMLAAANVALAQSQQPSNAPMQEVVTSVQEVTKSVHEATDTIKQAFTPPSPQDIAQDAIQPPIVTPVREDGEGMR